MIVVRGYTAPEVEAAYSRARVLCQQLGDTQDVVPALHGLWQFYISQPDLSLARQLGEDLLGLSTQGDGPSLAVIGHYAVGTTSYYLGELPTARRHLEKGLAGYTPAQRRSPLFRVGFDLGVGCHSVAALTLWALGYPAQALTRVARCPGPSHRARPPL